MGGIPRRDLAVISFALTLNQTTVRGKGVGVEMQNKLSFSLTSSYLIIAVVEGSWCTLSLAALHTR